MLYLFISFIYAEFLSTSTEAAATRTVGTTSEATSAMGTTTKASTTVATEGRATSTTERTGVARGRARSETLGWSRCGAVCATTETTAATVRGAEAIAAAIHVAKATTTIATEGAAAIIVDGGAGTALAIAERAILVAESTIALGAIAYALRAIRLRTAIVHLRTIVAHLRATGLVAEALTTTIVSTVETVTHTHSWLTAWSRTAEVASVVPTSATIHSPTMTTTVRGVEVRTTEEEVVAVWVASVDAEVPVSCVPVERTIEIGGIQK